MKNWTFCVAAAFVAGVSLSALADAASPPPMNIPDPLVGSMQPYVKQVDDRITYWCNTMRDAKTEKELLEARANFVNDYQANSAAAYRYKFAERVAELGAPMLKLKDTQKLYNAALAFSKMSQVSIQPLLEQMIVHPNASVRYLGWSGYREIRTLALVQGLDNAKTMFASLDTRLAAEPSPQVVGNMLTMLNMPSSDPGIPQQETLDAARKQSYEILRKNWLVRCGQVLNGDADMANACRKGVTTIEGMLMAYASDKPLTTSLLQMLLDMAWSASRAYDNVRAKGATADAMASLMKDIEDLFNVTLKERKKYIETPLGDTRNPERGAAVRNGVLNWLDDLKKLGVQAPQGASGRGSELPATAPATSAASQPKP